MKLMSIPANADVNDADYLETKNEDDHDVHDHKDTAQLLGVWGVFGGRRALPLPYHTVLKPFAGRGFGWSPPVQLPPPPTSL